jgi:hypothetical protein
MMKKNLIIKKRLFWK